MTDEERRAGFGVDSVKVGVKRERRPADANLMQGWCGESEPARGASGQVSSTAG